VPGGVDRDARAVRRVEQAAADPGRVDETPVRIELRLEVDNDFADLFEIKDRVRDRSQQIERLPVADRTGLTFRYANQSFSAETRLEVSAPDYDVIHSWWIPALGGKFDAGAASRPTGGHRRDVFVPVSRRGRLRHGSGAGSERWTQHLTGDRPEDLVWLTSDVRLVSLSARRATNGLGLR